MQSVAVSHTQWTKTLTLVFTWCGVRLTKDEVPCFLSLLCSVCYFVLFARRRNTAKQPKQGSNVSHRIVGHSTGQIKHTDLKELFAPKKQVDRLTQRTPHYLLFVQANNGHMTMAAFFSTMYHTSFQSPGQKDKTCWLSVEYPQCQQLLVMSIILYYFPNEHTFMLPQFEVNCSLQLKTKVHCMPFGQSCMCLDPMLIVFSFLRNQ